MTLTTGSRAAATREPCQVRKEAALSDDRRVPRNGLVRAALAGRARECPDRRRVHGNSSRRWPAGVASAVGGCISDSVVTGATPHQALYRRWRAQRFAEIVGQDAVVETLRNAVRTGRVAHAILFTGPARDRQDVASPGSSPRRSTARTSAPTATRATRATRVSPSARAARSTSSRSTRRPTAASTTSASSASGWPTRRPSSAARSTSSTRRTRSRRTPGTRS